jgi:segregation and condensation protein B
MRTLLARGLVEEAGQDHETGANLYRTTNYFLERIGVTSIDELPELAPFLPGVEDYDDEAETVAAGSAGADATDAGATDAGATDAGATDEGSTDEASTDAQVSTRPTDEPVDE